MVTLRATSELLAVEGAVEPRPSAADGLALVGVAREARVHCICLERHAGAFRPPLGPDERYLNHLFWFQRLVHIQAAHGHFDAGLEQQAFALLEHPPPGVGCSDVEYVLRLAEDRDWTP